MTHCRFSLGPGGGRKTEVTNSRRHFSRTAAESSPSTSNFRGSRVRAGATTDACYRV
jgi:hypothetical protein